MNDNRSNPTESVNSQINTRPRKGLRVCDTCLTNAREESEGFGLSPSQVARQMGSEIADHICTARDNGQACGCGCNDRIPATVELRQARKITPALNVNLHTASYSEADLAE